MAAANSMDAGTQTSTESPAEGLEKFMELVRSFTPVNWSVAAAMLIAFVILVVMNDRRKYIQADIMLTTGFGLAFGLFPKQVIGYQTSGTLDDATLVSASVFGFSVVGTAIVWYITRDTRDGTVPISLMMARVFSCSILLLCQAYVQFWSASGKKDVSFSDVHILFGMLGACLWLLINEIYTIRSDDFSTYPQHNIRINEVLRFDALVGLIFSVLLLAFPNVFLRELFPKLTSPNCVTTHAIRCTGAIFFNHCFTALQACGYLHEKDKKAYFISKIVAYGLMFAPLLFSSLYLNQFPISRLLRTSLVTAVVPVLALVGLYVGGTLYYRPVETKKYR